MVGHLRRRRRTCSAQAANRTRHSAISSSASAAPAAVAPGAHHAFDEIEPHQQAHPAVGVHAVRSRPASGTHSGSTLSASHEPPGRSGASHSSQARPSTIRPSRLATASQRVAVDGTGGRRVSVGSCLHGRWHHSEPMTPARSCLRRPRRAFPWLPTGATLRERFREDRLGLTASSLTFTTTIALVPFFTVALALFTAFPMFGKLQARCRRWLVQSLVPDAIARQVLGYLTQFAGKASRLGAVGLGALVFTRDRAGAHDRPHAQRHLARAPAAAAGAARADLLGGDDARAAAAGGVSLSITSYVISASRGLVAALPGVAAVHASTCSSSLLLALRRSRRSTASCRTRRCRRPHALAGGVFAALGIEIAQARARLVHRHGADLFDGVRRVRRPCRSCWSGSTSPG